MGNGHSIFEKNESALLRQCPLDETRPALSSVENVELETDTRRFHKEMYFLLTINNHFQVGADILEAVQFMHRMGVVHQVGVVRK